MIAILHLGLLEYGAALREQEKLVALRQQGRIPDVLLLVEHPPVITLGRNAKAANIVAPPELLAARGVSIFEINRGGDVTFHGPGQLVGYPIFDLRGFNPKLGAVDYVRRLEEVLIGCCGHFGLPTQRIKGLTGVWTLASEGAEERKLAAIGVHVSRGVTSHGFALNVAADLDYFKLIVPCGLTKPVTSIARETGLSPSLAEVIPVVTRGFGTVFGRQILWVESVDDLLRSLPEDTPAKPPEELRRLHGDDTHLA